MVSPVSYTWVLGTVLIDNGWGEKGTGFWMRRSLDDQYSRAFLVTNKHVLYPGSTDRNSVSEVEIHLNVKRKSEVVGEIVPYTLTGSNGESFVREHPDDNVDVLAIDVTNLFLSRSDIYFKAADYDLIPRAAAVPGEYWITEGDEVFVVGYPSGLRQGGTNYPLVRQGILATRFAEPLIEDVDDGKGNMVQKHTRGFLIDGATIPGSSGSPVVLKQTLAQTLGKDVQVGTNTQPLLLGILAETRFAPVKTKTDDIPSFAGLGMALDASTIRETIEMFFA